MRFCVDSKKNSDWLKHFAIDFVFDCLHVKKIKKLLCVISFIEIESKRQKENFKKKNKKKMSFEIFNQYRESRSISNESDANLIQEISAKRKLFESTTNEKKTTSVAEEIAQFRFSTTKSFLQILQMLFRWLIIMLASKTFETLFFDEYNITKFLDWYVDLCQNYDLEKRKKIRRLSRYCDLINEQYVQAVINANVFEWKEFCRTFCKDYKNKDLNQQLHSLKYLKIFKHKIRTSLKEISQYCRQYTIIFEKLIKTKKLQRTLRSVWFLQKLFEKFNEKLVIRCSLNENDENKMRFENLIKQTLQLIKSRSVIIKTRKTNYKTKRTTTLMKEMKSIIKKNVNEHFINLLKVMKSRIEESISKINVKLDDLTEVMKKWRSTWTIWSIACFFRVIEAILNRVKIINCICLHVILLQINRSCSARNHSRCFFKICFLRTCWFRIYLSHFLAMKSRARLLLNVFIATKRIICSKKNVLSSTRILKQKKFICKKEEFISISIISMFFTFEWSSTKVSDNALKTQRS
jgi:hypothetical protein